MIKAIIFDYDGVIVDSFPDVHRIYMTICKEIGKDCPKTLEGFKKVYGHSSSECYNQLGFNEEDVVVGNKIYKREIAKVNAPLFDGIKDVLETLYKDYPLIIISSSYRDDIEKKLEDFQLLKYFKEVIGREHVNTKRFEKVEAIRNVVWKYSLSESEVLLIGDRNIDFIEGSKAGLENIVLVDYGWGYNSELIPEYTNNTIITRPNDLLNLFKK